MFIPVVEKTNAFTIVILYLVYGEQIQSVVLQTNKQKTKKNKNWNNIKRHEMVRATQRR